MTALVKTSKAVKDATSIVRSHLAAVDRAREIYLAQIKRAEADYFDRITHAAALVVGNDEAVEPVAPIVAEQIATAPTTQAN